MPEHGRAARHPAKPGRRAAPPAHQPTHRPPRPFGPVQPKLLVGPSGDRYEAEAERVADRVVRAQDAAVPGRVAPPQISRLPREARRRPMEDEEEMMQPMALAQRQGEEEPPVVQALQAEGGAAAGAGAVTPVAAGAAAEAAVGRALRGPSQPIAEAERQEMEGRFGADFGDVRLHTGAAADAAASALSARAFTIGRDIVVANGEPALESRDGQRLLAHELTHVVQQTGARAPSGASAAGGTATARRDDKKKKEFKPIASVTAEWSAKITDRVWIDEHVANLSLIYTAGIDASKRVQVWGVNGTADTLVNLIGIGAHAETIRIGDNMDLSFDFVMSGPTVTITSSSSVSAGTKAGGSSGGASVEFTVGTTVTQTYQTSGPGSTAHLKRRFRFFNDGDSKTLLRRNFPSDFHIMDAEDNVLYGDFKVESTQQVLSRT